MSVRFVVSAPEEARHEAPSINPGLVPEQRASRCQLVHKKSESGPQARTSRTCSGSMDLPGSSREAQHVFPYARQCI